VALDPGAGLSKKLGTATRRNVRNEVKAEKQAEACISTGGEGTGTWRKKKGSTAYSSSFGKDQARRPLLKIREGEGTVSERQLSGGFSNTRSGGRRPNHLAGPALVGKREMDLCYFDETAGSTGWILIPPGPPPPYSKAPGVCGHFRSILIYARGPGLDT